MSMMGEDLGCVGYQNLKEHTMARHSSSSEKLIHVISHQRNTHMELRKLQMMDNKAGLPLSSTSL